MIDKPILGLLTFGSNPDFSDSGVFCVCFRDFLGIIGDGKAANKSAASAASLDYVKFQAVIKSAASAASPKAKSREGSSRERRATGLGGTTGPAGRRIGFGRRLGALPWSSLPLILPLGRLR